MFQFPVCHLLLQLTKLSQQHTRCRKENARTARLACWRARSYLFNCALHFFTRLVRSIACSAQDTNCQQSRVVAHYCSWSFRLAAGQSFSWIIVEYVSRRQQWYDYLSIRPRHQSIGTEKYHVQGKRKQYIKINGKTKCFSSKFNLLIDWHLENWVIANSAPTLADMIHGFMVLWPLKYLWYLVGVGVRKMQCLLQTPTKTKQN